MRDLLTNSSPGFSGGLVKPCLHIVLPVLPEVRVRDLVVVLHLLVSPATNKQED